MRAGETHLSSRHVDDGCLHRLNVPASLYSNKGVAVKHTFPSGSTSVAFYAFQAALEAAAPGQDDGFTL